MSALLGVTTERRGQLEGPQEVVGFLEVRAASSDLVDEIFNANNALGTESVLDDLVVVERDSALGDLTITTLVDQLGDGLDGGFTIGDVGLDKLKHDERGLVHTEEHTVVDLAETQQLEDLGGLRSHAVDTKQHKKIKLNKIASEMQGDRFAR